MASTYVFNTQYDVSADISVIQKNHLDNKASIVHVDMRLNVLALHLNIANTKETHNSITFQCFNNGKENKTKKSINK